MSSGPRTETEPTSSPPADRSGARPAATLAVVAVAQLMLTLDSTIMNIALPSIQRELGIELRDLSWTVTSYALAFGGLLLLGGRVGDVFGKRRMFRIGVALFTLASLLGGLAPDLVTLVASRAVQGIGAAIAAPTGLSLIVGAFPEGKPRVRAMGLYAAMAPLGSTTGLLLGGVLTEFLDWRWVFFVNVPIGVAVLIGTRLLSAEAPVGGRLDIPGALCASIGLATLIYALHTSGEAGLANAGTLGLLAAAVVLLALFLVVQARSAHPMMPLYLLRDRNRAGSFVTMLFIGTGMFATYYFLTLYVQQIRGFNPVQAGLSYLPFALSIAVTAGLVAPRLLARFDPRWVAGTGLLLAVCGMSVFSTLDTHSSYAGHIMPAMFVTGIGLGLSFVPMTLTSVRGVERAHTGIASGLLNASTQVGGALGLSALTLVAAAATAGRTPAGATPEQVVEATTSGYTTAFLVAAALYGAGLLTAVFAVNAKRK
ncbi:MFS transporter [Saccharopolyspora taberi]|uniref:MFS transporter n=1 Tax=Saccharopolyspora taberi TaxID=60895 RepID=A0ABN3VES9_9PSEU